MLRDIVHEVLLLDNPGYLLYIGNYTSQLYRDYIELL